LLSNCKSKKLRKIILKHCDDDLLKAIIEIVLNVLKGNVDICEKTKLGLKKYKKSMRKLICPQLSLKAKRKVVQQSGGFLNILLPTIIGGVLSHIFQK
jgi:hypothetical protein